MAHHREIVADEQIGQIVLGLEVGQQVQNLGLNGNVERRHRLVEHQDFGIEHERPGNGNALALAAGKHVGVAVIIFGAETHRGHHGARPLGALGGGQRGVDQKRFFQCLADLLARVQRIIWILENDLHARAQRPHGGGRGADNLIAGNLQGAGGGRLDHGDEAGKGGLAAA